MAISFNALIPELSVTDFEKSLDFYTRILGFSIAYKREEEGFAFLTLGQAQLMIDQIGKGRTWSVGDFKYPLGNGINVQVTIDNIEPLLQNLRQNEIKLFLEPEEKWYWTGDVESGNRQFLVQDPDGYLLRFTEDMGERPVEQIPVFSGLVTAPVSSDEKIRAADERGWSKLTLVFGAVVFLLLISSAIHLIGAYKRAAKQVADQSARSSPAQAAQVINLSDAWKFGTSTYGDPELDITVVYPSFFDVNVRDAQAANTERLTDNISDPKVNHPPYARSFAVSFSTPNQQSPANREVCENKMSVSVSKYENNQNLALYDFIARLYEGELSNSQLAPFEAYKKDLLPSVLPKPGSYVFEGYVGENPVKTVYFTTQGSVYSFGLIGNCDTGGKYTAAAEAVFDDMVERIRYR